MKIALAAQPFRNGDVDYNMGVVLQTIRIMSAAADLILFGEAFLQGFDALTWDSWDTRKDFQIALAQNAPAIGRIRDVACNCSTAVSFGYYEVCDGAIFSSQLVIGADGEVVHNFRRVSTGWKMMTSRNDKRYQEGARFEAFSYGGKRFAIALCGDLWEDGRVEEMRRLGADVVLWPVYCDYNAGEWNTSIKYEYAQQAALAGENVLLVNPVCEGPFEGAGPYAAGGAAWFSGGTIRQELPAGQAGILVVNI